jgi:hypothetical protein
VVRSYHQFGTSRLIITEIPRQNKRPVIQPVQERSGVAQIIPFCSDLPVFDLAVSPR